MYQTTPRAHASEPNDSRVARWIHSRTLCVSLGSYRVVGFTRVCSGGCWIYSGLLGSLASALEVDWFIRGRWVHWCAPWVSLGSFAVVVFTRVRPSGLLVCPGSLCSLVRTLVVVGFFFFGSLSRALRVIRFTRARSGGRSDHPQSSGLLARALGFIRFIRCRSRTPYVSVGLSGVVGFTSVRTGGRLVDPVSLCSL